MRAQWKHYCVGVILACWIQIAHAWEPSQEKVVADGVGVALAGFDLAESSMKYIPGYEMLDYTTLLDQILAPDLRKMLRSLGISTRVGKISLANDEVRSHFEAFFTGCNSDKGPRTPFGSYQHYRVGCTAGASMSDIGDSIVASSIVPYYFYTGKPFIYRDTQYEADPNRLNDDEMFKATRDGYHRHRVDVDLRAYGLEKAVPMLTGFKFVVEGGVDRMFQSIGVYFENVLIRDGVLSFDIVTELKLAKEETKKNGEVVNVEAGKRGYLYRVGYVIAGVRPDADFVFATKYEAQRGVAQLIKSWYPDMDPMLEWYLGQELEDLPIIRFTQLANTSMPKSRHACMPYLPQGFLLKASSPVMSGALTILPIDGLLPSIPGLELRINDKRKPVLMYDFSRAGLDAVVGNYEFKFYYAHGKGNTCPVARAVPSAVALTRPLFPVPAHNGREYVRELQFSEDLFVPNADAPSYYEASVYGSEDNSLIDELMDGIAEESTVRYSEIEF